MSKQALMISVLGLWTGVLVHGAAPVWVIDLDDVIEASSARYLSDSLEEASTSDVPLVVLRIDTPGGWMDSTRDIVKDILASPVPVAAYVSPEGASATSAGTYIVYASHVAAMAPATNIGSATPVRGDGEAMEPNMERKVVNDAVAQMRGYAELRGRNIDWAEKTVREATNLTASEALEQNVIDVMAMDINGLLAEVDGMTLATKRGLVTLATEGSEYEVITNAWFEHSALKTLLDALGDSLWWVIGIVLVIGEVVLPGTFLIWFAFAAFGVGLVGLVFDMSGVIQVVVFSLLSFASLSLGYLMRKRRGDPEAPAFADRTQAYMGKIYTVVDAIENGKGKIRVGDSVWLAEGEDCPVGGSVKVVESRGNVLMIEIVPPDESVPT
ncbi:MAG: NfeD family protein [Pseudomonadota bacterium]|nr:NfeD family protein [Pseudomonadota bacterium]MEC9286155.1 NfeD family protein [Pseudomonadota bacterium]MEE3182412.1 NfeD family protein [Pseudomonadota bacterium]